MRDDLQQLIGREPEVRIFQDAAAIPKGADCEDRINEALDTAPFIIPILTPAFLQSEWCREEVPRFREREKILGRNDLIFPFHLTNTDHLDRPARRFMTAACNVRNLPPVRKSLETPAVRS